jgi:hypothetical protein
MFWEIRAAYPTWMDWRRSRFELKEIRFNPTPVPMSIITIGIRYSEDLQALAGASRRLPLAELIRAAGMIN